MIITFANVPHRREYLRSAIESARIQSSAPEKLDIKILADAPDASYLEPDLQALALPRMPRFGPNIYRITDNHLRALKLVSESPEPYGFICEDDIQFAKHWDRRALEIATANHLPILSLCSAHELDYFDHKIQGAMRFRDCQRYYGHQSVLWAKDTARRCAQRLEQWLAASRGELNVPWLIEGATRVFCSETGTTIWATHPSLVNHVGFVSAWESVNFQPTLRFDAQ